MYAYLITQDADYAAILELILKRTGLVVTTVTKFEAILDRWLEKPADLIMSSISHPLPIDQVRQIRAITVVPLILVIDPLDETNHFNLLKAGADLVIDPPFSPKVLIAQIEVLMRRAENVPVFALPTLDAIGLSLDPVSRILKVEDRPACRLTHLEFRLLYTLMMNRDHVMSSDAIVASVWGYSGQGELRLVRGLINRLRAKVELDRRNPRYIHTISGVGYKFSDREDY